MATAGATQETVRVATLGAMHVAGDGVSIGEQTAVPPAPFVCAGR